MNPWRCRRAMARIIAVPRAAFDWLNGRAGRITAALRVAAGVGRSVEYRPSRAMSTISSQQAVSAAHVDGPAAARKCHADEKPIAVFPPSFCRRHRRKSTRSAARYRQPRPPQRPIRVCRMVRRGAACRGSGSGGPSCRPSRRRSGARVGLRALATSAGDARHTVRDGDTGRRHRERHVRDFRVGMATGWRRPSRGAGTGARIGHA